MFTVEDRNRVHTRILEMADADHRVVAGAVVGSLAIGEGDRWSDLDLSFAVADGIPIGAVLEDWTNRIAAEFAAVTLFDLPFGSSIYRVFLLPGCLQFDLSFSPASQFGALAPTFRLLFGTAVERPQIPLPAGKELFGYAVHHALRARFCIERGRFWQGEYWISSARDYALNLACLLRGLPAHYGKGFDSLPAEMLLAFRGSFVSSLNRDDLMRALRVVVDGMLLVAKDEIDLASTVEERLRLLTV